MAYNNIVADRFRQDLIEADGNSTIEECQMFGALGFMVNGNLTICVGKTDVMFKVGQEQVRTTIASGKAEPAIMGRRTMKDWMVVSNNYLEEPAELTALVKDALEHNRTTRPKV